MTKKPPSLTKTIKAKATSQAVHTAINDMRSEGIIDQKWEDLEDHYQIIGSTLLETLQAVQDNYRLVEPFLKDHPKRMKFDILVGGIIDDCNAMSKDLAIIHTRHINRSGIVKDGDDLAELLSISEDYNLFNTRYTSLIIPNTMTLAELSGEIIPHTVLEQETDHGVN